ncbi:MAG: hypothetical protein ACN2B6_08785 [Rickettsiales bacterium]
MSQQAVISLSRPKVHRLPSATPRTSKKFTYFSIVFAAILLLVLMGMMLNRMIFSMTEAVPVPEMAPMKPSLAAPVVPAKEEGTIVITDKSQAIVGQLTKIPSQNQQITGIKSVSEPDKKPGKELLSIVNKH